MSEDDVARPDLPYARSAAAKYLTRQIDALSDSKTQRQIAKDMGYDKPNILSMFKRGESKIPVERVPLMAKALHVDPAHLMRLVLEQHYEGLSATLAEVFGGAALSRHERALVALWREATNNEDPDPTGDAVKALRKLVDKRAAGA